jgi:hypothetical protein
LNRLGAQRPAASHVTVDLWATDEFAAQPPDKPNVSMPDRLPAHIFSAPRLHKVIVLFEIQWQQHG